MRAVIKLLILGFALAAAGLLMPDEVRDRLVAKAIRLHDRVAGALDRREIARTDLSKRLGEVNIKRGAPVFVRVFKEESELELWMRGKDRFYLVKTYPICKWSGRLGPKLKEGDRQSPEGFYAVGRAQLNPNSRWHLSFNLGYPNAFDRAHGRTGSFLMVHGGCSSIGCYAITNPGIDEVYRLAEAALYNGQRRVPVHVFPFRMTARNMTRHADYKWMDFWRNLKDGYDLFEETRLPPGVRVCGKHYAFDGTSSGAEGGHACQRIAGF